MTKRIRSGPSRGGDCKPASRKGDGPQSQTAATNCNSCPFRKNAAFRAFEAPEAAFVERFKLGELLVQPGSTILSDGHDSPHLYTILEGWTVKLKLMEDGRRQVLNFGFPGDMIGLQSALFSKMMHTVETLTEVRLCVFARSRIWELFEHHAGLAFDLTWLAAREESIVADHLANVGQRSAYHRIAYVILYIFERARRSGLVRGNRLKTPVTQEHLADAMGLSVVHTSKTIKRLGAAGAVSWSRGEIVVHDRARLGEIAGFDLTESARRPFV